MTAVLDDVLLDDPARLAELDQPGLLRAAATAGAQVRSTAESALEAGVEQRVAGGRPRALVLLTGPVGRTSPSALITALLGPGCPIPVVTASTVPSWVGALDVVLAHADDPADIELAESVERATRRGASVVVTAPAEGPVAAAAAGGALLLPTRVDVPRGFGFPRAVAAALCVTGALGLLRVDFDRLAGALDAEAERSQPGAELFVNPAKTLAVRIAGHSPLLWGLDALSTAAAGQAAYAFAAYAGVVCDVADVRSASDRPALRAGALRSVSGDDIFADPDIDGPDVERARLMLLSVSSDEPTARQLMAAKATFEGADVLTPADELPTDPEQGALTAAMVLALRTELAALYLGLATGALGPGGRT